MRPEWALQQRRYPTATEIGSWCRNFREFHGETWGFLGVIGWQERVRRRLAGLDAAIMPLIPREWRYIIFACARK